MWEVGMSSCGKILDRDLFAAYQEAGIKYMEISPGETMYASLNFEEIGKLAGEYGVKLWSFHLPFVPFKELDISSTDEEKRLHTVNWQIKLMEKAAKIGITRFVVHGSAEPIDDAHRPARLAAAKRSLFALAEAAGKLSAVVALEDLPRTCLGNRSDEILELLTAHPALKVCFDTNHLLGEDNVDFIRKVGDKIITTHVSDYDFVNERHWLPGEGKVDWAALVAALKEVNYTGVWMYEIGFQCPKTIYRDRDLTCEDFTRNADEVLSGKNITVFSTPKPNIGMWE